MSIEEVRDAVVTLRLPRAWVKKLDERASGARLSRSLLLARLVGDFLGEGVPERKEYNQRLSTVLPNLWLEHVDALADRLNLRGRASVCRMAVEHLVEAHPAGLGDFENIAVGADGTLVPYRVTEETYEQLVKLMRSESGVRPSVSALTRLAVKDLLAVYDIKVAMPEEKDLVESLKEELEKKGF